MARAWDRRTLLGVIGASVPAFAGCSTSPESTDGSPAGSARTTDTQASRSTTKPQTTPDQTTIHVSPDGGPNERGTADDPYAGVQAGLDDAAPGETVELHDGTYSLDSPSDAITTVRSGTAEKPITIRGGPNAVVTGPGEPVEQGGGSAPLFELTHNHIHLVGMTLDGLSKPASPDSPSSYRGNLVDIRGTDPSYLHGIVVQPARVGNTLASGISLEYVRGADVGGFELVGPFGLRSRWFETSGSVGEVVYVGQSVPTGSGPDRTRDIRVHHIDNTAGYPHSELVNVKPATRDVLVEYCTDHGGASQNPATDLASVNLQCAGATVRWCDLSNNADAGVRIGVNIQADEFPNNEVPEGLGDAGTGNAIYGNRLVGNGGPAIAYAFPDRQGPDDQRVVCGNETEGSTMGTPMSECPPDIPQSDEIGHTAGES